VRQRLLVRLLEGDQPARNDERVVGQLEHPPVGALGQHQPPVQVELANTGEQRAGVALFRDHAAQRGRDQAGRQDPGRDLVEQRLEQVVVGPVDHGDVHVRVLERSHGVQPAEAAADHHHPVQPASPSARRPSARRPSARRHGHLPSPVRDRPPAVPRPSWSRPADGGTASCPAEGLGARS
jgi:hypothetical protein